MSGIERALDDLGISLPLIVAGVMGGFVKTGNEKRLTLKARIFSILSGGAIANYLTPLVLDWARISEASKYGFAFILGFSGLKGVEFIILKIQKRYTDKKTDTL